MLYEYFFIYFIHMDGYIIYLYGYEYPELNMRSTSILFFFPRLHPLQFFVFVDITKKCGY